MCAACAVFPGEFIIGRVIKAMNSSWHPDCFCCDLCQAVLADVGFVKNAGRSVQPLLYFRTNRDFVCSFPVENNQHMLLRYVLKHGLSWSCAGPK